MIKQIIKEWVIGILIFYIATVFITFKVNFLQWGLFTDPEGRTAFILMIIVALLITYMAHTKVDTPKVL